MILCVVPLVFLTTVVSSPLLSVYCKGLNAETTSIGQSPKAIYHETLTGFKFLANEARRLEGGDPPVQVVLAYEEALGYMITTQVLDKDGISALMVLSELIYTLQQNSSSLSAYIDEIYRK